MYRSISIHPEYGRDVLIDEEPFYPGEFLGGKTQSARVRIGDILTWVEGRYYFDPDLKIDGIHFKATEDSRGGWMWIDIDEEPQTYL